MARMIEKALVVLLNLKDLNRVFAITQHEARDVLYLVLTLLLVIWWIRYLEVLLVLRLVELHEAELGEAMLKADAV